MISKKMEAALNAQIALEGTASFVYLSMASWCDRESLLGCAAFMHRQSAEEHMHMMKIFHYVNEVDGHALSPAIKQAPSEWKNVRDMFENVYEHEKKVTASINKLVDIAVEEKDNATYNFLQWYVNEQREEEALMRTIIDRIKLIGDGPHSLYYIDKEIKMINEAEMASPE